jgi:hypothetical protein
MTATNLHVSCITHATLSGLSGSFVLTGLKANIRVPHTPDLLLAKVSLVLGCHLGPDPWPIILRMKLRLLTGGK